MGTISAHLSPFVRSLGSTVFSGMTLGLSLATSIQVVQLLSACLVCVSTAVTIALGWRELRRKNQQENQPGGPS